MFMTIISFLLAPRVALFFVAMAQLVVPTVALPLALIVILRFDLTVTLMVRFVFLMNSCWFAGSRSRNSLYP